MYLVTVFDSRSTNENPVEPRTMVILPSQLSSCLDAVVDKYHHCIVAHIDNFVSDVEASHCDNDEPHSFE